MSAEKSLLLTVCGAAFLLAGCAKKPLTAAEEICIPDLERQYAMEAAEQVLGKMFFSIDKSDAEIGYIRSRPLIGGQFFEFWRKDNVGAFNWAESNLHTIRRIVELNMSPRGKQLCISCDVWTQRLRLQERETKSRGHAYAMFSESSKSIQKLKLDPEQERSMAWVDLGEDTRLAAQILKQIKKQLAVSQKEKRL